MNVPGSAVEAAAKAEWAVWAAETAGTSPWDQTSSIERKMWLGGARAALAAAVPLLCQPLQDEIDRLRARIEAVEAVCSEADWHACNDARPDEATVGVDSLRAALAAVPVGTGGAE